MDNKDKLRLATKELTEEFVTALSKAGKELGLGDEADLVASQTVSGSAELIKQSGIHPIELADRVCSPGGTTIEGLLSLKKDGFEELITTRAEKIMEEN